jgi:tetratricopeptide (TPR) repeat protein
MRVYRLLVLPPLLALVFSCVSSPSVLPTWTPPPALPEVAAPPELPPELPPPEIVMEPETPVPEAVPIPEEIPPPEPVPEEPPVEEETPVPEEEPVPEEIPPPEEPPVPEETPVPEEETPPPEEEPIPEEPPAEEETPVPEEIPPPEPVPEEPPVEGPDINAILELVYALLEAGDYGEALAQFDLFRGEDAQNSRILLLKASIFASSGDLSAAKGIADDILSREPENTRALLVLAALEGAQGREREQKAALERIIRVDPKNVEALIGLGNIAIRGQNRSTSTAASFFDRALAQEPENLEALLGRAGVYRYARNPKDAEALLNKGLELYPKAAALWSERARLYREAGFLIQALEDLNTARELDGNDYWIAMDRGMVLLDLNRKQLALEEFIHAQSLNPDHFLSYVYTAGIKDEAGDYAGAEADYQILIKLRPDYYFAQEGLGMLKMRNHQWEEARNAFIQAYNQAPAEWSYALLAMMNWRRMDQPGNIRDFANLALRKLARDSLEYAMLRLYLDMSGDDGVARRVNQEKDPKLKARMLYYLANYYDIKGIGRLADAMFFEILNVEQRTTIPEWRLVQWALEERNLAF